MNIGELADRTGLSRSRIRFYESKGLLSQVSRSGNGYRSYQPDALIILKLITTAQQAGFSLSEIAKVLPADLTGWKHDELVGMLRQKVNDLHDMMNQLDLSRRNLEALIEKIEHKPADMSCGENAREILATLRSHGDLLDDPGDD